MEKKITDLYKIIHDLLSQGGLNVRPCQKAIDLIKEIEAECIEAGLIHEEVEGNEEVLSEG